MIKDDFAKHVAPLKINIIFTFAFNEKKEIINPNYLISTTNIEISYLSICWFNIEKILCMASKYNTIPHFSST